MFSDELKINFFGSDGILYVRIGVGERFNNECVRRIADDLGVFFLS